MSMRAQFTESVAALMVSDPRIVLLLGDIGVHGFRKVFEGHPDRAFNMGICEQAMVGAAAGMAKEGMIPIVHTIAPFLVERALEQIKVDFGYQRLHGVFVSVGASHDYASMGASHHCPGDVEILKTIPGTIINVPGAAQDLDRALSWVGAHWGPIYIRLSEAEHAYVTEETASGAVVQRGALATIVAVGPMLHPAMEVARGIDAAVVYYEQVKPFDWSTILKQPSDKVLLVEPYYEGGLVREIVAAMAPRRPLIRCVGVPREFQRSYGTREEHDKACGLDAASIRKALEGLIDA